MQVYSKEQFDKIYNEKLQKLSKQHENFRNACKQFQDVCKQIKTALNLQEFKGGFDEMIVFQNSEFSKTVEGLQLAIKWSAVNELCLYEAKKIGIGQPDWWYRCWQYKFE